MKKKIIGALLTGVILYFLCVSYYDKLVLQLDGKRIGITEISSDELGNETYTSDLIDFNGKAILEYAQAEDKNITLNALSAALIDAESGRVLYEKTGYKQMAMASTTKIMTCIIALEKGNLDDEVTVSRYAASMPDVQLNIKAGEKYRLRDLLYSLMLESHNDVSVAIAEHIGGSVEGFAALMNEKAKELGCENTNFVTPNGLDADGHYTTAVELARIAAYAIKNEDFIKITNTASYQLSELTGGRSFSLSNKDRFLYMYDGAIGVKTGFTNKAGYCFVGAVKRDGKTLISAVLGSGWPPNKNYKWKDTTLLMNHGVKDFYKNEIFYEEKEFKPLRVFNGKEDMVDLYYEGSASLLMRKDEIIKIIYQLPQYLVAPIKEETIVGNAKYYIGDELLGEYPILTTRSIDDIDFKYIFDKVLKLWLANK